MIKIIKKLEEEIKLFKINNIEDLEVFKKYFVGKQGLITKLFKNIKYLSEQDKKNIGLSINNLKINVLTKYNFFKQKLHKLEEKIKTNKSLKDLTIYSNLFEIGSRHPISILKNKIINIFSKKGFTSIEGTEIEDDWHNFTALNFPYDHPARDMQDTFFIKKKMLLRTHTSSVQIRYMENNKPPIQILSTGKVYRKEVISRRSHCIFNQVEGLYVNTNVSFIDLKKIIEYFINTLFNDIPFRLRPSYFPFTEPSAEVDIYLGLNNKVNKIITNNTGWLEIMGCGMVDPYVLKNVNIDPEIYSGFAFGIGIERIALLYFNINDIRIFFQNDIRFLKQFKSSF
ncbi:MAG: phenylalanine--tRNA ligase subunit alpha [Candidatus Bostrichicola ureolyticus]|nr:MAG: phenylalanine--tRNA ligase subunit alpha [Candidatus Bostrichicola ureolyticus]